MSTNAMRTCATQVLAANSVAREPAREVLAVTVPSRGARGAPRPRAGAPAGRRGERDKHLKDNDVRDFVEWCFWPGMRPEDIRSLTWADFDRETWAVRLHVRSAPYGRPEHAARRGARVSGHRTRRVFDRYNIVDEQDIRDAVVKTTAYGATLPGASTVIPLHPVEAIRALSTSTSRAQSLAATDQRQKHDSPRTSFVPGLSTGCGGWI
jgi:hypothetical protein